MAFELPGAEGDAHVVRILETDAAKWSQQVPTGRTVRPPVPTAQSGVGVHDPVHHVQRVDVLLGDDVAGEDLVETPGPQAILGIVRVIPPRVIHPLERAVGVVDGLAEGELAECTFAHPLQGLHVERVGAGLEIDEEAELLGGGLFAAVSDAVAAGHIDGDGLGDIYVACRPRRLRPPVRDGSTAGSRSPRRPLCLQQSSITQKARETTGLCLCRIYCRASSTRSWK